MPMQAIRYTIGITMVLIAMLAGLAGCHHTATTSTSASPPPTAVKKAEHVAHHGGCLNAVVTCENGHAEVTVVGDTLKCWFVGGGPNTGESVPIGDTAISLSVMPAGSTHARTLVLQAEPLKLAEETMGHCSYFEGKAAWLSGLSTFVATGKLRHYQGKSMPLRIEYPGGYDPD